jgi:hypothetical protein
MQVFFCSSFFLFLFLGPPEVKINVLFCPSVTVRGTDSLCDIASLFLYTKDIVIISESDSVL